MTREPTIRIPYGDWLDEYVQAERDVSDEDKLLECIKDGLTTPQVGRLAIVARERKEAKNDILPPNKLMLATGAMHAVSSLVGRQKRKVVTKSGKEISVREFIAPVPEEEELLDDGDVEQYEMEIEGIEETTSEPADNNPGVVMLFDPEAVSRARRYLYDRVPGYVYGRLAILAANDENVRDAAGELVKRIWGVVERLE